jgi:hypothetical protein
MNPSSFVPAAAPGALALDGSARAVVPPSRSVGGRV